MKKQTLSEWQRQCAAADEDTQVLFTQFSGDLGRLARAIRDQRGLYAEAGKAQNSSLEKALGHTLRRLCQLANRTETDLDAAFREKDARNAQREWKNNG